MWGKTKLGAVVMAAVLAFSGLALADNGRDAEIQARLAAQLEKKAQFKDVHASVEDGMVTLRGTVDSLARKLDAEKTARRQDHVTAVRDLVQVAGPDIPDASLQAKLAKALAYDRVGYGNVYDYLTVGVRDGVVNLSGEVHDPVARESAIEEVVHTPGVKGIVENVKVAPLSSFDDELRVRTARAIYGDPDLSRYAMDPQAPMRIVVDNGHVGLYGVVQNNFDRTLAGLRASGVAGAFSVENHLQTARTAE